MGKKVGWKPTIGWEKVDVSHMSKQQLFEHLKAIGRIPSEIKSYGCKGYKGSGTFWSIWKRGYYWAEPPECNDNTLSEAEKADLWFLAAELKMYYSKLPEGKGHKYIRVDIKGMKDAALLYLLKKLEVIPQDIDTLRAKDMPRQIYRNIYRIKSQGFYCYGYNQRDIMIDISCFVNNINYVERIIKTVIHRYNPCDYHEAYSRLLYKAYEMSGHKKFLVRNWLVTVLKFVVLAVIDSEKRYYSRFISYDSFMDDHEGRFSREYLVKNFNRNHVQLG